MEACKCPQSVFVILRSLSLLLPLKRSSHKTINQLASEHQLHPSQISQWKKQLLEQGSDIFAATPTKQQREQNDRESSLYEQIGRLNMELDWLKKKATSSGRTETDTH